MRQSVIVPALAVTLIAASLGACSTVVETVQGPQLAPIGYPAQLVPVTQSYTTAPEPRSASATNATPPMAMADPVRICGVSMSPMKPQPISIDTTGVTSR